MYFVAVLFQVYLKERYFELGMLDSVMPNTCVQETSNGEVNIQLPLQANRADSQQFECITNLLTDGDEWVHVQPSRGQSNFKYLLDDRTLSLHVRFEQRGVYQLEIIGKEESSNDPDLNEFEWIVIYQVEVKGLPERVIMFPTEESIGWGPGRKVTETGLEVLSHREGTYVYKDQTYKENTPIRTKKYCLVLMYVHSMCEYDKGMSQSLFVCEPWYREEETQNTNQSLLSWVITQQNYKSKRTMIDLLTTDTTGLVEVSFYSIQYPNDV